MRHPFIYLFIYLFIGLVSDVTTTSLGLVFKESCKHFIFEKSIVEATYGLFQTIKLNN